MTFFNWSVPGHFIFPRKVTHNHFVISWTLSYCVSQSVRGNAVNIMDTFIFFLIRFIIFAFLTGVDEHRRDRGKTFGRNKVSSSVWFVFEGLWQRSNVGRLPVWNASIHPSSHTSAWLGLEHILPGFPLVGLWDRLTDESPFFSVHVVFHILSFISFSFSNIISIISLGATMYSQM